MNPELPRSAHLGTPRRLHNGVKERKGIHGYFNLFNF